MNDVLANAKGTFSNGANVGQGILEFNVNKMKKWTKENVDNALDENDNLKGKRKAKKDSEKEIVSKSRKRVFNALKLIARKKNEEHAEDISTQPTDTRAIRQFTKRLISKENILSKFKKVEIEL